MKITQRSVIFFLTIILFSGNVLLASQYYVSSKDVKTKDVLLTTYQHNEKVLSFTRLFIAKVLKAKVEVSFEDRLQLENAVRDLNNKEILNQWQKFTDAKEEIQAQEEVKNLLELLIRKISY